MPSRSKGRLMPFRTWDRAIRGVLTALKQKEKSVLQQLEEEGEKK